jgi:hypothetical protein
MKNKKSRLLIEPGLLYNNKKNYFTPPTMKGEGIMS